MGTRVAGPTLRALVAANIGRMLVQRAGPFSREIGDPARSGVFRDESYGVVLTTTNFVDVVEQNVESRLTWDCVHPLWRLRFTERRRLDDGGSFERIAPFDVSLAGDLIDAARFLGMPRELFFGAARADGWGPSEIVIEGLRWLDIPYAQDGICPSVFMRMR